MLLVVQKCLLTSTDIAQKATNGSDKSLETSKDFRKSDAGGIVTDSGKQVAWKDDSYIYNLVVKGNALPGSIKLV